VKPKTNNMLTYKDIKEKFGISRQTIDRAVANGLLVKKNFAGGKKVFFEEAQIKALFETVK